jgi:hypothetical protein
MGDKKQGVKVYQLFLIFLAVFIVLEVGMFLLAMSGIDSTPLLIFVAIAGLAYAIFGIELWVFGARYEKMTALVRENQDSEAVDALFRAAGFESNYVLIDAEELEKLAKKAKVKLELSE